MKLRKKAEIELIKKEKEIEELSLEKEKIARKIWTLGFIDVFLIATIIGIGYRFKVRTNKLLEIAKKRKKNWQGQTL